MGMILHKSVFCTKNLLDGQCMKTDVIGLDAICGSLHSETTRF